MYNINTMIAKKILGAVMAVFFIGAPVAVLVVSAEGDPCAYGPYYDVDACAAINASATANQQPVSSGSYQPAPSAVSSGSYQPAPPQGVAVNTQLVNPVKYANFSDFVAGVIGAAVNVLMPFVVLAFIYSGFIFVKAQGNEAELETAKKAIRYSIVGAFILFGAWGFAQIIGRTISTVTN